MKSMDIGVLLKIGYVVLAILAVSSVVDIIVVIRNIKNGKIGIIKGVLGIVPFIFACFVAVFAIFGLSKEMKKQGDDVLALHPYGISEITYGDVFNKYCGNMKWSRTGWDNSTSGMSFIQLDANCMYGKKERSIIIQFEIGKREFFEFEDDPYFHIVYMELDDKDDMSMEEMEDLLYTMFVQYIEEKGLSISIPESQKGVLLHSENSPWYNDAEIGTFDEDMEDEMIEDEAAEDEVIEDETIEEEEVYSSDDDTDAEYDYNDDYDWEEPDAYEYIFEDSDSRYLTAAEIKKLDSESIRLAKNEIYARHGRKFQDKELQRYFNSFAWYKGRIEPEDFDEGVFNKYEKKNVRMLAKYE